MNINEQIKKIRIEKEISTYELSKLTGISQSTISKLENGKRKADFDTLIKIADALGVTIEHLIKEDGREVDLMDERIDKTINNICDWLNKRLNEDNRVDEIILADMTKALAELVTAKASLYH